MPPGLWHATGVLYRDKTFVPIEEHSAAPPATDLFLYSCHKNQHCNQKRSPYKSR